jgi:LysR family nitrogen assimilation transcriptional regulator
MDLKQIEYFVQVAELGSFTRAAALLRVAQPALSRQVRALEVELRQPLFDRNGRGVTLTEGGKRLLAHGRGILAQVERAHHDLEAQRGAATGHMAIGLPPSVGRVLTVPLVQAFRERLPRATLTVVEGLSVYALEWLAMGRIDCAVAYNVTPAPALDLQPMKEEPLFLVSARGSAPQQPVLLSKVAEHELVVPSRPHSLRMLLETALAGLGLKPRVGLEIDSVPAILDLVERHPLHAVLARNALRGREGTLVARPIVDAQLQPLSTTLWLATASQRPRGPLVAPSQALLTELIQQLW